MGFAKTAKVILFAWLLIMMSLATVEMLAQYLGYPPMSVGIDGFMRAGVAALFAYGVYALLVSIVAGDAKQ